MSCDMIQQVFGVSDQANTNWAGQPQKIAIGLKFPIEEEEGLHCVVKTKGLISCAVTAELVCVFVFAYYAEAGFLMTWLIW